MKALAQRLVFCWMLASGAHLPLPVLDNEAQASAPRAADTACAASFGSSANATAVDLDYILLGCQAPHDADDGPVDHDPEQGDGSATFLPTRNQSGPLGDLTTQILVYGDVDSLESSAPATPNVPRCDRSDLLCACISLGAMIPMRC